MNKLINFYLSKQLYAAAQEQLLDWHHNSPNTSKDFYMSANLLGELSLSLHLYDDARQYFHIPLNNCEDKAVELVATIGIGRIHLLTGQTLKAKQHSDRARELANKLPLEKDSLSKLYLLQANIAIQQQQWKTAYKYCSLALKYAYHLGHFERIAEGMVCLSSIYINKNQYVNAQSALASAILLAARSNRLDILADCYAELARLAYSKGNYSEAVNYADRALNVQLTTPLEIRKSTMAKLTLLFAQLYIYSGHRNSAIRYLNKASMYFSEVSDSQGLNQTAILFNIIESTPSTPKRAFGDREELKLRYLTSLLDMIDMLERIDTWRIGHAQRVAHYALIISQELKLDDILQDTVVHAALLHDVGLIAVTPSTLNKPDRLTFPEREQITRHPEVGEAMIQSFVLNEDILDTIRYHHEHFDGSGYPSALKADEIPLTSRIISIADTYDALLSPRPYRKALSHQEAINTLESLMGTALDPHLVKTFIKYQEPPQNL